jgi:hypothetical protein
MRFQWQRLVVEFNAFATLLSKHLSTTILYPRISFDSNVVLGAIGGDRRPSLRPNPSSALLPLALLSDSDSIPA